MSPNDYSPTMMTRKDEGIGEGLFDSIAWIFETHLQELDNAFINSALFYGHNEDYPERVEFFSQSDPTITDKPVMVWKATD